MEILELEEMSDGRVWAKWRTTADDGLPLEEGDYLEPGEGNLEAQITEWLADKKQLRAEINARPKPSEEAPVPVNGKLSAAAKRRIMEAL